jgi:high-affinity Fe2+/Pb2+ permease
MFTMSEPNPSIPLRVADGLEQLAAKVREMTVDRAAVAVTWAAVGVIAFVAAVTAIVWLLVGIFRALGTLMGTETAYAVVGLILILVGAFVWSRRYPQDRPTQQE